MGGRRPRRVDLILVILASLRLRRQRAFDDNHLMRPFAGIIHDSADLRPAAQI